MNALITSDKNGKRGSWCLDYETSKKRKHSGRFGSSKRCRATRALLFENDEAVPFLECPTVVEVREEMSC